LGIGPRHGSKTELSEDRLHAGIVGGGFSNDLVDAPLRGNRHTELGQFLTETAPLPGVGDQHGILGRFVIGVGDQLGHSRPLA